MTIRILVFTASYNEKQNIKELIEKILKNLPHADILIIDDNSPDQTSLIVKKMIKKFQQINLIVREKKLGLDTAHKLAFNFAKKNNYDYFISMDADLSHDPIELKNFILQLKNFPFVIGSRYIIGGKCLMTGSRLFTSIIGNYAIKFLSGINCNEYTTSYRGFNLNKLGKFNLNSVNAKGYSFFMGTIFKIVEHGFSIKEIPITFADRKTGVSKIPKFEIFRTLKNLILLSFRKYFY
ncbi:glycosyltransferase group 2 [alpha proteobacterium HIMB5]|nr:glycosyltransferase group 2 [alpha proteobacterium HIMB5]